MRRHDWLRSVAMTVPLAVAVAAAACGGDTPVERLAPEAGPSTSTPPTANAGISNDQTAKIFDQTVLHTIDLEVASDGVSQLIPGNDERVDATLTFDGTRLNRVGLRLKGGLGTLQPLEGKPGFSVDTDEFFAKQALFGVTRFTLGNAIQDPSFVTESVVYEVFQRAGVIAPRTALATVRFNGETFGVYVLRESYDKNFLRRTFTDPEGNLYEGDLRVDITDVEHVQLQTNESKNDRSDLRALARAVAEAPDESFLDAIGQYVDLEQLLTYWSVEALVHHWDGLIRPNNYYAYHDPLAGKLVFLAHGADWAMLDPTYSVLAEPGPTALLGLRLYANPSFRQQLSARILDVLNQYWDATALITHSDQLAALVRLNGLTGSREQASLATFESELAARKSFIESRPAQVRAQLGVR